MKKAIALLEYIALILFIVLAFISMQSYLKRAIAGNWRSLGDTFGFGRQYEEGVTNVYTDYSDFTADDESLPLPP